MKKITLAVFFAFVFLSNAALAQRIPEPSPKVHCSYDGKWYNLRITKYIVNRPLHQVGPKLPPQD